MSRSRTPRRAEKFGRAFTAAYPGITVEVIRTTGQVAFQRLMLDIKNHTPHCDVFSATDISHMPILKERHELTAVHAGQQRGAAAAVRCAVRSGWYYVTNAGRWVLIRNSDKVPADAAPKAWTDLLDPRWKGQLSVAHPAFSGGAGVWTLAMRKLYGWQFFEALAKNDPRVGRSTQDTVTLLSGGECQVGPTWAPGAYRDVDKGNPIGITQPRDGVVVMVFPSAIPAGAPHPNAARLFMEWMLSQELFADDRRRRQRANPRRCGTAAGRAAARDADGDRAFGGGDPQGRAGGHRAVAGYVRRLRQYPSPASGCCM